MATSPQGIRSVADGLLLFVQAKLPITPDECPTKFPVLPKRWIVERSFSWLENFRRQTIDYEYLADTAEAMVQLAFAQSFQPQSLGYENIHGYGMANM